MPERKILVDMVFFLRNVKPVFDVLGWTIGYSVTDAPPGEIMIHSLSDTGEATMPKLVKDKFTRILDALALTHGAEREAREVDILQMEERPKPIGGKLYWHYAGDDCIPAPARLAEPGGRPLPPLRTPVFDYSKLREDPENDRRIREYSDRMIMVGGREMVETVKPAFETRGWIYSGNHYGDGSVGFQVVLDGDDKVVAPTEVVAALRELCVHHRIHYRKSQAADEDVEDGSDDEEFFARATEEELLPLEDQPVSLDAAEAERQEATEAAMEAEEGCCVPGYMAPVSGREGLESGPRFIPLEDLPSSQPDATGALRLKDDEEMHIRGEYIHATGEAEVRLQIGQNVVTVVGTFGRIAYFLTEAGALSGIISRDRQRLVAADEDLAGRGKEATGEETRSDGGKEKDDVTEQGQASE